jgi:hypothetical protein
MILRKYQRGDRFSALSAYKPVLTQEERVAINNSKDIRVFPSSEKECAGDACRNMMTPLQTLERPNYYTILANIENAGGFKDKPSQVLKQGANSSWHNAGIASENGAVIHYNEVEHEKKKLDEVFNTKLPVGSFVLFGTDNSPHEGSYSATKGFKPSSHTLIVYGYDTNGEPLLMDGYNKQLYRRGEAEKEWKNYHIQTVFTPKEYIGLDQDNITAFLEGKKEDFKTPVPLIKKEGVNKEEKEKPIDLNTLDFYNVNYNSPKYYERMKKHASFAGPDGQFDEGKMSSFMQTLHQYGPQIATDLRLNTEDYTKLANLASSLALNESKGGRGVSGLSGWVDRNFTKSQGITQLSLDQIDPKLRSYLSNMYDIKDSKDLNDPSKSAIATIYHLAELSQTAPAAYKEGLKRKEYIESNNPSIKTRLGNFWRGRNTVEHEGYYTKGNIENMPWEQQMAYGWRGLKKLKTGDAQGKDQYTKNILEDYENFGINPLQQATISPPLLKSNMKSLLYRK